MTNADGIEKRLTSILHESAKKLNISDYSLNLNLNALRGDGFLGEFYKVSITDNVTKNEIKLAIKKAPEGQIQREAANIGDIYKNEIWFYSEVFPTLRRFENEHQIKNPFNAIPDYITSVDEVGKEMIVLKDITVNGFELREKSLLLDDEHTSFIFKTYGHFHAISFCLKEQNPQEYYRLVNPIMNVMKMATQQDNFCNFISMVAEQSFEALSPVRDIEIKKKFQKYVDNTKHILGECVHYKGIYSAILHGDCWSNNMMFKYQDPKTKTKLEAMNLLDFQIIKTGSPVYDLSYFFYTGGSKQLFDKLEHYLDIYHDSFSKAARNLGSDPTKLLPRKILSEEWKIYAKFGMLLSLMLVKVKLISKEDSVEFIEKSNDDSTGVHTFLEIKHDEELFKKRVRDILVHMYEINAL